MERDAISDRDVVRTDVFHFNIVCDLIIVKHLVCRNGVDETSFSTEHSLHGFVRLGSPYFYYI